MNEVRYHEPVLMEVDAFSLQSALMLSPEEMIRAGERINRVRDDAGDEHLAHVSCLSHRCRITTDTSVTAAPVAVAFAAVAVLI